MKQILKDVIDRLKPIGLPIYTAVPINPDYPHIHITEITSEEAAVKDYFVYKGSVTIAFHYKGQDIDYALSVRDEMRQRLKRYKGDSPAQASVWMMYYNTEDGFADEEGYNYTSTLVFNYELKMKKSYYNRVEDDNGVVENINCVL